MSSACRFFPIPSLSSLRPTSRLRIPKLSLAAVPARSVSTRWSPLKVWRPARVSCFKEENGEEVQCGGSSEFIEIKPAVELDGGRLDAPSTGEKQWVKNIRKEWRLTRVLCFKKKEMVNPCSVPLRVHGGKIMNSVKLVVELDEARLDEPSTG